MDEILTIEHLQYLVRVGFTEWKRYGHVAVQPSPDGTLLGFNYTAKAQYAERWNFFERVSRGLLVHRVTGEIVARGFDKFFNFGEGGRTTDAPIVRVTEKVDGSLGALYRHNGLYLIATRGRPFDSKQGAWATEFLYVHHSPILHSWADRLSDDWTLIFEIIYPGNRVVVDYGDTEALFLLAIRNRRTGDYVREDIVDTLAASFGFPRPFAFDIRSADDLMALQPHIDVNQEGWVAEFADGQRFKFKGDAYTALHKLISNLSFKHTLEAIATGSLDEMIERIPDEFLGDVRRWTEEIRTTVDATRAEIERAYDAAPKELRRDFAVWVREHHEPLAPYLFARLDGRDLTPLIYRHAFQTRREEPALFVEYNKGETQ